MTFTTIKSVALLLRRQRKKIVASLLALVALFIFRAIWGASWATITPGVDTTILGDTGTNSYDYHGALRIRYASDITPENNALLPFLRAIGPSLLSASGNALANQGLVWERDVAPEGAVFEGLSAYMHKHRPNTSANITDSPPDSRFDPYHVDVLNTEYNATFQLWVASDHPDLAAWIAINARPLDLLVEASRKPRLYIKEDPSQYGVGDANGFSYATIVRPTFALLTRAMLSAGSHNISSAREDILAAHRIARLMAQGPSRSPRRYSLVVEQTALAADLALAQAPDLPANEALQFASQLAAIPALPNLTDVLQYHDRFALLDRLIHRADGLDLYAGYPIVWDASEARMSRASLLTWCIYPTNYNAALRRSNQLFDRIVGAETAPHYAQRRVARSQFRTEAKADHLLGFWSALAYVAFAPADAPLVQFLGPLDYVDLAEAIEEANTYRDLTTITFALRAYHADHHTYPPVLAALAPHYLPTIPPDAFSEQPLHYTPSFNADSYLLYSVGLNITDDHGKSRSSFKDVTDDITVTPANSVFPYSFKLEPSLYDFADP